MSLSPQLSFSSWHCFIFSAPPAPCLCHRPRNWPWLHPHHPPPLHLLPLPGGHGKSERGSGELSRAAPLTASSQRNAWGWRSLWQGAASLFTAAIHRTVQIICIIHGMCCKLTLPWKLLREKTFANFEVLWLFMKDFAWCLLAPSANNTWNFSLQKSYFPLIHGSFLSWKFPTIRYVIAFPSHKFSLLNFGKFFCTICSFATHLSRLRL